LENLARQGITNEATGFTTSDMQPSIKIIPLLETRLVPELSVQTSGDSVVTQTEPIASKINLRSDWSLVLFTLLAAGLFALFLAAVVGQAPRPRILFPLVAVAAMGCAATHLGKKSRAWRATLNVAQSWLSREIFSFSLFAGVGTAYLWFTPDSRMVGWAALLLGVGMVVSADRVYTLALKPQASVPHSAGVALTGLFLGGVLAQHPLLIALAGGIKLFLYLWRKSHFARTGVPVHPGVSTIRISLGFAVPLLLWSTLSEWTAGLLLACVLVAELIDRSEYYAEVEIMTPDRQMALDLENWPH
jgi:DMSO reductase anchor subunit